MWWDRPLYLHFLDRELGEAVGLTIDGQFAEAVLKQILLGTTSRLYCGLSLAWENPAMTGMFPELLSVLVQTQVLDLVSNHATLDEFLETRISLYEHDFHRYPMYFDDKQRRVREALVPTSYKPTSATHELARELAAWAVSSDRPPQGTTDRDLEAAIRQSVSDALSHREGQAVTFPLFAAGLPTRGVRAQAEGLLRRRISSGYTRHYAEFADADIPTGVRGFEYFDELARSFPLFDIFLLSMLMKAAGLSDLLEQPWKANENFWSLTAEWRSSSMHARLRNELTVLLSAVHKAFEEVGQSASADQLSRYGVRQAMYSRLRTAMTAVTGNGVARGSPIEHAGLVVRSIVTILQRDPSFSPHLEVVLAERNHGTCDVLIAVATEVERDAVLHRARELTKAPPQKVFGKRRTYFDVGLVGGSRVALVQTEMGSVSPGASLPTVGDAIDDLRPSHVVMVGIAFGVDPDKQELGQILVSRQLQAYELQRVGAHRQGMPSIALRGDKVTASTKMLGRLRASTANWGGSRVEFGLMMSGEKLVDNVDFRDQLVDLVPEAIGGEMEGAGLYAASADRQTEWILVKAICDWADGKKRFKKQERQSRAASEAANFVFHAIAEGGLGKGAERPATLLY